MNMVCPDEGKQRLLETAFGYGGASMSTLALQMFTNDYTPDDDTTLTDFVFATFTGGEIINWTAGDWDAPTTLLHVGEITKHVPPSWTNTGGGTETCYGWALWDTGSGRVLFAQRFDAARVMSLGATETLDPFTIRDKTFA